MLLMITLRVKVSRGLKRTFIWIRGGVVPSAVNQSPLGGTCYMQLK